MAKVWLGDFISTIFSLKTVWLLSKLSHLTKNMEIYYFMWGTLLEK